MKSSSVPSSPRHEPFFDAPPTRSFTQPPRLPHTRHRGLNSNCARPWRGLSGVSCFSQTPQQGLFLSASATPSFFFPAGTTAPSLTHSTHHTSTLHVQAGKQARRTPGRSGREQWSTRRANTATRPLFVLLRFFPLHIHRALLGHTLTTTTNHAGQRKQEEATPATAASTKSPASTDAESRDQNPGRRCRPQR